VGEFHGGNPQTRQFEAERFVRNSECRFMVASYAGGHGNTWTVADTVVYYSNDYDLEKRAQSEDRAHRAGQTAERVLYVDLVVPGTVDEKILRALREKITLASTISGDTYREWLI
jgi:SNF2 family DNA or RNA helicase